jgi:hypothetical protein
MQAEKRLLHMAEQLASAKEKKGKDDIDEDLERGKSPLGLCVPPIVVLLWSG